MGASTQDNFYSWVVCAATFLVLVILGGLTYSMGVFYIMFKQGLDAGDSALSLVTSLNYSIMYLVCPFVGILTEKYGERPLAIIGAFLAAFGVACSSFTSKPYQLYLSYSLIGGIGCGLVYNPCMSILEKYFKRYIRVGAGIAACGDGVGAFVFPPIIRALEDKYGWRGALLLVAGITANMIVLSCLYRPVTTIEAGTDRKGTVDNKEVSNGANEHVHCHKDLMVQWKPGEEEVQFKESKTQNDSTAHHKKNLRSRNEEVGSRHSIKANDNMLSDLHSQNVLKRVMFLFKSLPFLCLCLHSLLSLFPTVLVYTHLGNYILTLGFTKGNVVTLYVIMGINTTITRALSGALAEFTRISPTVIVTVSALVNGLVTILLPLTFTQNLALIYVYGVLFSTLLAPYDTLCFAMTVDSVHKSQVATGYGVVCFFCAPGSAFGAPLAALIYNYSTLYASSFYLAGGLFILTALTMIPALCQMYAKGSTERTTSSQEDEPETKRETEIKC